jgi:hypothetical protein
VVVWIEGKMQEDAFLEVCVSWVREIGMGHNEEGIVVKIGSSSGGW